MTTSSIFGIPVYHGKVNEHNDIKEKFKSFFDEEKYFGLPNTWLSPCKTSIHNETAPQEVPFNSWIQPIIQNHFIPYIESLNPIQVMNLSVETLHVWMNKYDYNEGQEPHNHLDGITHFSCAYIFEQPEDSCDFLFIDKQDYFSAIGLAPYFYFDSPVKNHQFELEEGDILIFPSFVDHAVSRNRTQHTRKTISANFRLNYKNNSFSYQI